MAYTPSFNVPSKAQVKFSTNNPLGEDRKSNPVIITRLAFNEITRSIEVTCSDNRVRQCRIDRLQDDKLIKSLEKSLKTAMAKRAIIQFVAAGANNPDIWFYDLEVCDNQ
jgi:hypothetical protein